MAGESNWELERILLDIKADRAEPRHLPLEFLKDITRDFSDDLELGRGGFGVVYKGVLKNGEIVAVKRLKAALGIVDKQFENEAHLLRLKHENIVRFLGHCSESRHVVVKHEGRDCIAESQEKLLCLEYMPNGSLDRHIKGFELRTLGKYDVCRVSDGMLLAKRSAHDASSGLNWNQRYKIIKGICSGLHFLHDENQTNTPVIHTDLKPANILLTSEMIPKITDFGLSRLFGEQQTRTYTESRGTHGYMAREFLLHGKITKKSDIFSLGVIVLEMITGNRDYPWSNGTTLPQDYVKHEVNKWRKHMKDLTSTSLENNCRQIKECMEIGLTCVETDESKRPTAKKIIERLDRLDSTNVESPAMNNPPRHDYQSSDQRTCAGCGRPFGHESILIYDGSHWHHQCFKCFACKKTLSESTFPVKENRPYHESCYKDLFHPRCSVCNNFIPADAKGVIHYKVGSSGQKYCTTH